ncbi:hypothetical protein LSH36_472g01064 [Paralvinella palmiformis]|uniref:Galactosyltransferase C-terminal domain-containing protein n=1 Tax=Paralvinella palmiformis TaxID=53620 RepID=A0AAD9J9A0_9ANNE|nr:hypothetical protein LSH36_472g01064 [Paralvinella palmiformis]
MNYNAIVVVEWLAKLRFDFYFGGAISLKPEHIEKINGFPNRVFGWGGEDDEIFARVNYTKLNVLRYPLEIGRYVSLPHGEDKGNPHVPRVANQILSNVSDVIYKDGLNSMNYTVIGMERRKLFTQVLVRIPGPTRMEDLPDYIAWVNEQEDIAAAQEAKKLAQGIVDNSPGKDKAKRPK